MKKILKFAKLVNAVLYLCAAVLAIVSIWLESSLVNDIYWCFFGIASMLLLSTSIIQLIQRRK